MKLHELNKQLIQHHNRVREVLVLLTLIVIIALAICGSYSLITQQLEVGGIVVTTPVKTTPEAEKIMLHFEAMDSLATELNLQSSIKTKQEENKK